MACMVGVYWIQKYQLLAELDSSELVAGVLPGAAPAEDTDSPESRRQFDRAQKPLELTAAVFHNRETSSSPLYILRMVCSLLQQSEVILIKEENCV